MLEEDAVDAPVVVFAMQDKTRIKFDAATRAALGWGILERLGFTDLGNGVVRIFKDANSPHRISLINRLTIPLDVTPPVALWATYAADYQIQGGEDGAIRVTLYNTVP